MAEKNVPVVLITGASRLTGIGAAVARAFAARDRAHIWLNYPPIDREVGEVVTTEHAIKKLKPSSVQRVEADVRVAKDVDEMVSRVISTHGRIDVLVTCAGILGNSLLAKLPDELRDMVFATHISGTMNAVKAVAPHMWEQGYGRIVTVASVVGLYGNVGQAAYAGAKGAIIAFTKTMAQELPQRKGIAKDITVNCVAPGFIDTDMTAELPQDLKSRYAGFTALNRWGTAAEVADAIYYLTRMSYVNGAVLSVDGGVPRLFA